MKCEIIKKNHEICGKPAKYKVRHKDKKKTFLVCEDDISCYRNKSDSGEDVFIIEELEVKYIRGDKVCDNCEDGENLAEECECWDCGMTKERELACELLGEFEEFLAGHNVKIPNEERDEYDADEGTETAILFGSQYYTLEDTLTEMIKKFKLRLFKK